MATIADSRPGFPGSDSNSLRVWLHLEVLLERGYNTYCVGKWHLTPGEECNQAAYKGRWPLGRGFERFYGWLGGETNSYFPDLVHDNHPIEPPGRPQDGYHLADDMADQAVKMISRREGCRPRQTILHVPRPPGRACAASRSPRMGRQVQGHVRRGLRSDPRGDPGAPDRIGAPAGAHRAVDDQSTWRNRAHEPRWQRVAVARHGATMGLVDRRRTAHVRPDGRSVRRLHRVQRFQLGKVLDELERTGELDNTLIVVVSDNGASGEGGPNGSFNEWRFFNGVPDTVETTFPHLDELGTPASNNHYNTGWAWAFDTPFPYWKRWAGAEVASRGLVLVAWPAKIPASAEVRHQYIHAVDIVPTIYALLDIEPPAVLKGYTQAPLEGESFAAALTDADVAGKSTQFYTMLGQRSIYHEGWLASTVHPPLSSWGNFMADEWELYHLTTDRSQSMNIADEYPDQLELLKGLWFYYAGRYNGLPLDDRNALEQVLAERPRGCQTTRSIRLLPGYLRRARVERVRSFPAVRTRSMPASRLLRPTSKVSSGQRVVCLADTACTSRTASFDTPSTGSGRRCRMSLQIESSTSDRTSALPSS